MLKIRLFQLVICLIGGGSLVAILTWASNRSRNQNNGFIRMLPSHKLHGIRPLKLENNVFYIAGADSTNYYLGYSSIPSKVLIVDTGLRKAKPVLLTPPSDSMRISNSSRSFIEFNRCYLADGLKPGVLSGAFSNLVFNGFSRTPFFSACLPLSPTSFIMRAATGNQNILIKQSGYLNKIKQAPNLLQKQIDGIFCTDGSMVKVPNSDKLFYVYYYRNQFICADTNLNLLYRGKTIDTVSRAHIEVSEIKSNNQTTLSSPPLNVNKQVCANEEYLFVHSALKADNETREIFEKASVIDVYTVSDGKYQFSFYLPDFNNKRMTDFRVYGQTLLALFGNYLYKFKLEF